MRILETNEKLFYNHSLNGQAKRQLLPIIKELMPGNVYYYYEPLSEGGIIFDIALKGLLLMIIILTLAKCYQQIKDNPQELIDLLKYHQENNSKDYYLQLR